VFAECVLCVQRPFQTDKEAIRNDPPFISKDACSDYAAELIYKVRTSAPKYSNLYIILHLYS